MNIGFIGAGAVATHLGNAFSRAGHSVERGSRNGSRSFADAICDAHVAVIAIPYHAAASVLPSLAPALRDTIVIDATNPLNDDYTPLAVPGGSSAGESIARMMPGAKIVKAFNTVFADVMNAQDVSAPRLAAFIAGDDAEANGVVADLASGIGFTPFVAPGLVQARWLEGLAHLNITLAFGSGLGTGGGFAYLRSVAER